MVIVGGKGQGKGEGERKKGGERKKKGGKWRGEKSEGLD